MSQDQAKSLSDRAYDLQPIGNDRKNLFVRFGVSKQNYDATPLDQWYKRHDGGVLMPVELLRTKQERGLHIVKGGDSEQW